MSKVLLFFSIFIAGELAMNLTLFNYLRKKYKDNTNGTNAEKIIGINISIFKGLLERFVLYFALTIGLSQILIVFGALKIGTKFDKGNSIKNDYFLIGNFASLLVSITYHFIYYTLPSAQIQY